MLAGRVDGRKTSFSSISEAVGEFTAGRIDEAKLSEFEQKTCPTCGSCSGMYTANSMNCLTEVLGMGLRGNGTIPAVYSQRIQLAKEAGMQVMELFRRNIRPRDIMTEEAFRNALTMDMALGCSTNSMLHLPAIANECGIRLNVEIANEISEKNTQPVPPGAGWSHLYGGFKRGRRCLCCDERDQQAWLTAYGADDLYRENRSGEYSGMRQSQSRGDPSGGEPLQ